MRVRRSSQNGKKLKDFSNDLKWGYKEPKYQIHNATTNEIY
jgi:hypothetical protein